MGSNLDLTYYFVLPTLFITQFNSSRLRCEMKIELTEATFFSPPFLSPQKNDVHISDEGLVWGGIFGSFCCCRQKGLAHVLNISYGVMKALVCEILFSH